MKREKFRKLEKTLSLLHALDAIDREFGRDDFGNEMREFAINQIDAMVEDMAKNPCGRYIREARRLLKDSGRVTFTNSAEYLWEI